MRPATYLYDDELDAPDPSANNSRACDWDVLQAALLALLNEYSDISDADVEAAADLERGSTGLWSAVLRARRARRVCFGDDVP